MKSLRREKSRKKLSGRLTPPGGGDLLRSNVLSTNIALRRKLKGLISGDILVLRLSIISPPEGEISNSSPPGRALLR